MESKSMTRNTVQRLGRFFCALLAALLMAGCASLPPLDGRTESKALTPAEAASTRLGQLLQRRPALPPELDSGIRGLPNPLDAFAARVLLARAADRSLDVQYYIWHDDVTGNLLLRELFDAAERGVRVRLLVDDSGVGIPDATLALLSSHPNAEVRLFNPFAKRGTGKALGFLYDFSRLNHRMHNKSFTADGTATIVGGRNVGDEYFGASAQALFADLDVIAVGKAARDVSAAFDLYWSSDQAYPVEVVIGPPPPDARAVASARLAQVRAMDATSEYTNAIVARVGESLVTGQVPLEWVKTQLVFDDPVKATGKANPSDLLFNRLVQAAGGARRNLDLVSPYFVPGKDGTATIAEIARRGIPVRILTNSLASSDGVSVHSGYARYREELLRAGVRMHEMKPDPDRAEHEGTKGTRRITGSSGSTLHAKTFSVDRERLFVGSFNLDQRSLFLNTEMGLVVHSRAIASALSERLDRQLPDRAFEVKTREDGPGLYWIEQTPAGVLRHETEPKASAWRRIGAGLLSLFPIEWLL
jgi:putative cardiolipin synthase